MDLSEFIINDIKPQTINNSIGDLQSLLNHLTYSHVPVQKDGAFIGMISENDVFCLDSEKEISEFEYTVERFFVTPKTNWLDVLEAFAKNSSNVMPVIDPQGNYLGYYELNDIISLFSEMPFFIEAGAVLIVEKGVKDFSFSEVSQIIESNNAKLFGAFLSKVYNDLAQITIKLSAVGLSEIAQTFRRYGYNIVSSHEEDSYLENLKDRSDYLRKYLNI